MGECIKTDRAMIWFIVILAAINVVSYFLVWLNWRKDCKEIGKDRLAVSLKERFQSLFICLTLPCILGIVAGWKGYR